MDNTIVTVDQKQYYFIDVTERNLKCIIKRVEGDNTENFNCLVLAFYIPVSLDRSEIQLNTDQWYGDGVYFLGLTNKPYYDQIPPPQGGGGTVPLRRNSVFLKTHSSGLYEIDWDI